MPDTKPDTHGRLVAQQQFDALPPWVQKLVSGLAGCGSFGGLAISKLDPAGKYSGFYVALLKDNKQAWWDGFFELRKLAAAMTAPWPPATSPVREQSAANLVEMIDDHQAFDQPCAFGNRCDDHAVYCHNDAWRDGPRKCRRTWYSGGEVRDEDCPGFAPNPDFTDV
jgi:hypothetical protein